MQGERMIPERVYLREGRTSPPGFLSEAELIEKMEKYGIGTDASIPTHINNICLRNYVEIGAGRVLKPTQLGVVLVHGYHRIDPDLVMPKVRAAIERECNMIAAGKARKETVLQHALEIFQQKFVYFVSKVAFMDTLFQVRGSTLTIACLSSPAIMCVQAVFDPLAATGKPLSRCGKCRRFMRYIPLKPQRLYCPTCNETYNLPQNGTIKLYKEVCGPLSCRHCYDLFYVLFFAAQMPTGQF
jgi:DNA topoisomerase-3